MGENTGIPGPSYSASGLLGGAGSPFFFFSLFRHLVTHSKDRLTFIKYGLEECSFPSIISAFNLKVKGAGL